MNIEGLGPSIIRELLDKKLIKDISDIYSLSFDDLLSLERFKEKSANNLVESIERSKKVKLSNFIYALGIKNVGLECARTLEKNFESIDKLSEVSENDLLQIDGIGKIVAQSILDYFKIGENLKLIGKLKEYGLDPKSRTLENENTEKKLLLGKNFVITGTLKNYSREEITDFILENGGKVLSSVSKKTDYLISGENAGSKLEKAKILGVKIVNENEFINMTEIKIS